MADPANLTSDDWEHIEDIDTFSVLSFSASSDDTTVVHDQPAVPPSSSPSANPVAHPPQSESLARNDCHPPAADADGAPAAGRAIGRDAADKPSAVEPDTSKPLPREPIKYDGDLKFLCETVTSLVELVTDILVVPRFCGNLQLLLLQIKDKFKILSSRLNELRCILYGYSMHQSPGSRVAELPVGLSVWLLTVKSELLCMREGLVNPHINFNTSYIPGVDPRDLPAVALYKKLAPISTKMDAFLTAIRSDYQDFHTSNLPNLSVREEDAGHSGQGRSFNPIMARNSSLAHLRRELYTLRHQIVALLDEIHHCLRHGSPYHSDQQEHITALILSYKKTQESLEFILSNHGSDWADHGGAGGLTYQEFCRLNPDTIRSSVLQLKEATDGMQLRRVKSRAASTSGGAGANGTSKYAEVAIAPTILKTLGAVEEVLVSILRLQVYQSEAS
ncbi:hypothetical protein F4802DRAFT_542792 [Xylaria palmicola]|nr:hypothetical protein F4802DRAFT_542792 [Xylaria palmicola]